MLIYTFTFQLIVKQLVATKMDTARSLYYWLSCTTQEDIHLSAISCPKLSACYHTYTFFAISQKYTGKGNRKTSYNICTQSCQSHYSITIILTFHIHEKCTKTVQMLPIYLPFTAANIILQLLQSSTVTVFA